MADAERADGRADAGAARWRVPLLSTVLLGVGALHMVRPRLFDAIMPPWIPAAAQRPLTYASGVAELAAGALLLPARTRRLGAWAALLVFLGVYPANVDAALRGGMPLRGVLGEAWVAWVRLPFQLPLVWWSWQLTRRDDR